MILAHTIAALALTGCAAGPSMYAGHVVMYEMLLPCDDWMPEMRPLLPGCLRDGYVYRYGMLDGISTVAEEHGQVGPFSPPAVMVEAR